jgi:ribose 5-phosphate isomerase B
LRVVLGADHRGYQLKDFLVAHLRDRGFDVIDIGTNNGDSVDYSDLAVQLGATIQQGKADRGILVCGSGVGASIAANKLAGIRAGVCHDTYSAHQAVEHDDMNVLCLGARVIGPELASEVLRAFLAARFSGEERHVRRVSKIAAMEAHG